MMLHQPRSSTLWGNRCFFCSISLVSNQLTLTVKSSPSITTFKTNLKSHLFKQAYSHNPAVLICLSLLKRHEHLPEADTNALLSVLYYYYYLLYYVDKSDSQILRSFYYLMRLYGRHAGRSCYHSSCVDKLIGSRSISENEQPIWMPQNEIEWPNSEFETQ